MDFDPAVLDQLDKWIRTKGGRVQVKLINEFYQKNQPTNKSQLFGKLHLLADCKQATAHLVGNAYKFVFSTFLTFLELTPLVQQRGRVFRAETFRIKALSRSAAGNPSNYHPSAQLTTGL